MHEYALFYIWDVSLGQGNEYLPTSYDSAGVLLPQLLEVEVSAHSENILKFATELQQLAQEGGAFPKLCVTAYNPLTGE